MRRLDLKNYKVTILTPAGVKQEQSYDFKEALITLMFHPNLRLSGKQLLETNMLAEKLINCKENEILLEEEEYNKIKSAIDGFQGYSKNEVKLVERIYNCPQVDVKEK